MTAAAVCDPLTLSAAFVVGVAGSVHCLAMCGGIAGALGMRTRRSGTAPAALHALANQFGRVASYTLAGALVGAFGGLLQAMFDLNRIASLARVVSGLMLVSVAVAVLFGWRPLARLERLGGRFWSRVAPLARVLPATGFTGSVLLGMLWGWLPCGFIYSMLIFAALTGSAWPAAATMLCFGLGTVPAVFAAGLMSARLARAPVLKGVNVVAGCMLLVFGALTAFGPLGPLAHMHH